MCLQKLSFEKNVRFVNQQFILEIKKMKDLGTLAKKYLFPALVIITGLYLVFMGIVPDSETGISQNSSFLIGGFTILLLGVLILLFVMDIIKSKKIQIGLYLALLLPMCLLLTNALYSSINTTIEEIETKKQKDVLIKQALNDIKDIELEYRKKYGWFSSDFDELKRFLIVDSVYSIDTEGDIPDHPITEEHQAILGYNTIDNYIEIESYDEEEALKCGLIKKDTNWTNVLVKLFTGEQALNNERVYPFDLENFSYVPSSENTQFAIAADVLESDDESFEFLYQENGTKKFVSSQLVDRDKDQEHLYNSISNGIVLSDTISANGKILKGDVLVSLNDNSIESMDDFLNNLKGISLKDSINLTFTRVEKETTSTFSSTIAISDLKSKNRKNLSSILIYLEEKFSPLKYNPENFTLINIGKDFTQKESELSKAYLDSTSIKKFCNYRSIYNGSSFEYDKNILFSESNPSEEFFQFFTTSKIGTPVFTAYDPKPYDPLMERDTLRVGSLKEVKTNGNWDE